MSPPRTAATRVSRVTPQSAEGPPERSEAARLGGLRHLGRDWRALQGRLNTMTRLLNQHRKGSGDGRR